MHISMICIKSYGTYHSTYLRYIGIGMLNKNVEWDFIITKALKYCNNFQQWQMIELPGPRDADASKNENEAWKFIMQI